MDEITIVITDCKEIDIEKVKLCLHALKVLVPGINVHAVAAGASSDGLRQLSEAHPEIVYVACDEENWSYGKLWNYLIKEYVSTEYIMMMTPNYILTPHCVQRLLETIDADDVGVVGPMSNGFNTGQKPEEPIEDWDMAVAYDLQHETYNQYEVVGIFPDVFVTKRHIWEEIGTFDESLLIKANTFVDFEFSLHKYNYKILECDGAVLYAINQSRVYGSERSDRRLNEDRNLLKRKWGMNYLNVYPNVTLLDMINHDRQDAINVLEVGCDCGANLVEIRKMYPNAVLSGFEISETAAAIAEKVVDTVKVGNVEEGLPFTGETFDYIIFGDVLEHLHDPERILVECKEFLKQTGCVIACVPNLMFISVMANLVNGNFTYSDQGILDRTHIHMFTYHEIVRMFDRAGYKLESIVSRTIPISDQDRTMMEGLLKLMENPQPFMYETFQYLLRAVDGE